MTNENCLDKETALSGVSPREVSRDGNVDSANLIRESVAADPPADWELEVDLLVIGNKRFIVD